MTRLAAVAGSPALRDEVTVGPDATVAQWRGANTSHPHYDTMVAQYSGMLADSSADQAERLAATIGNATLREVTLNKIAQAAAAKSRTN